MAKKSSFRRLSIVVALVVALSSAVTAFAITITVDGDREAAWSGSGGQTPGTATDPNEGSINDNVDIETFQWTNDTTNFYFLVDVQAAAPLMPALAVVDICLDTDNSTSTDIPSSNAIQRDRCSYGTGVSGIDTVVEAYRLGSGTQLVDVYDVTQDPPAVLGSGTLGYNPSATTPVVEISAALSTLGYGPGSCPGSIPMVVYYDGGDTNPDDNLPDSGTTNISCGSPTAVTLSAVGAQAGPTVLIGVAFGLVGLVALGALVVVRRRQT
jgi:MYXO-CTERM domain-containing protein